MQFFKIAVSVDNHAGFRVFRLTLQKLEIIAGKNRITFNWPMFPGLWGL
jgi:hypothetical protein